MDGDDGRSSAPSFPHIVKAFVALQLTGGACILIIWLTAALHPRVTRYKTWHSFCLSWIISALAYSLLTFANQQFGPPPNFSLCLIQGALVYSAPILNSATTLALAIHTYLTMRSLLVDARAFLQVGVMILLLFLPYLAWMLMILVTLTWGIHHPEAVRRGKNGTYCNYRDSNFSTGTSIFVMILTTTTIVIQVMVAYHLYSKRKVLAGCGQSITMAVRVMAFTFCGVIAVGLAVAWVAASRHDQAFELFIAIMPVCAAIIFGSQGDLTRAWMFWKPSTVSHSRKQSTSSLAQLLNKPIESKV